eukprot:m51a1_g8371 putative protein serine threonine (751) ;mRNA; r:147310-150555
MLFVVRALLLAASLCSVPLASPLDPERRHSFRSLRADGSQCTAAADTSLCPLTLSQPAVVPAEVRDVVSGVAWDTCCRANVERFFCATTGSMTAAFSTVRSAANATTYFSSASAQELYDSCKGDCFLQRLVNESQPRRWVERLFSVAGVRGQSASQSVGLAVGESPQTGCALSVSFEKSCSSARTNCSCATGRCPSLLQNGACCANAQSFQWAQESLLQCRCLCAQVSDGYYYDAAASLYCYVQPSEALLLRTLCNSSAAIDTFITALGGTVLPSRKFTVYVAPREQSGLGGVIALSSDECEFSSSSSSEYLFSNSKDNGEFPVVAVAVAVPVGAVAVLALAGAVAVALSRRRREPKRERALPVVIGSEAQSCNVPLEQQAKKGLHIDKQELHFADGNLEVKREYHDRISISNHTDEPASFEWAVASSPKYVIEFSPRSGTIEPGGTREVFVGAMMNCTTTITVAPQVSLNAGAACIPFPTELRANPSYFIDWDEIAAGEKLAQTWKGLDVALKCYKLATVLAESAEEYLHESRVLSALHHPNIVTLYGICEYPQMTLVMEFAPLGPLSNILPDPIPLRLKTRIALDTASGIAFLHQNNILHRDLKPDNLLMFSMSPDAAVVTKLTDFGSSRLGIDKATHNYSKGIGTPHYMSPEVLSNKPYSVKADVFSFGVVLWELFTQIIWDIAKFVTEGRRLPLPSGDGIPPALGELISCCWEQESSQRPDISNVVGMCSELVEWAREQEPQDPAS